MGNSASGFDISGDKIDYNNDNKHWALNLGTRKEGDKEAVTIFSFQKKQFQDKLAPAQRCIQKSKTLKHPFIVSFIESADYDESLVLVTEQCMPLEAWLIENAPRKATDAAFGQELIWGFRCVLEGLQFLHSNGLTHGYLGLHAIFVTKGGDMKLGALDLVANLSNVDDFGFLKTYAHLLNRPYLAPERQDLCRTGGESGNKPKGSGKNAAGAEADIFSLAHCIQTAFNKADIEVPSSLAKYFSRMMNADPAKRPSASQLIKCPIFNSDDIKLLISLGELAGLKPANETLEILNQLSSNVENIPKPICLHKILPSLARALLTASTDFSNRDARESCRQSIQLSLNLLSQLAARGKIDEEHFTSSKCLPGVLQLWTMTDRAVRTALMGTLKQIVVLIPASAVNKSIFDQLLAGFADSNAKMREDTLKCLVHVVDKLDEKHLQEKLVRCIVNLQADAEASIRTNATIFLGRIAGKLKDGVRERVLGQAFLKALRDPFLHCRIAGLKATVACLSYMDHSQLTSKILPQACVLLLDRSREVRELSLGLLDQSLVIMKDHHTALCASEKKAAESNGAAASSSSLARDSSSRATGSDEAAAVGGWGSWGSLSKTLEKATGSMTGAGGVANATTTQGTGESGKGSDSEKGVVAAVSSSSLESSHSPTPSRTQAAKMKDGWDDNWGDIGDGDDADLDLDQDQAADPAGAGKIGGWGDDDDFDIDDVDNTLKDQVAAAAVPKGLAPSATLKKKLESKAAAAPAKKQPAAGPSVKLGLDEGDNWDDF